MAILLSELPTEIIFQILLWLPPTFIPTLQQVSRHFNDLSQPLLWRHHCRTQFQYWSPKHRIREKFLGSVASVDWKKIFSERHIVDRSVSRQVDSILSCQINRIGKTERILANGSDAKDTLLRHINTGDEAEDVLARRFYSDAVLSALQRNLAVEEWIKLSKGEDIPLERALTAFDMFVSDGTSGDFGQTAANIEKIVKDYRNAALNVEDQTPREKTIALAEYLRANNLVAISGDAHYHDLRNNFIGIALQHKEHPSLPLISVAIYCCVAKRLGIDAQPCGFPFHVHAIIFPPPGCTMDGNEVHIGRVATPMYMDPFRSSTEVPVENLEAQLRSMGIPSPRHHALLGASSIDEIVRRCATNIIASVQAFHRRDEAGPLSRVHSYPEMDGAFYAALWALMLFPDDGRANSIRQRAHLLSFIIEKLEGRYLMDVGLVETHLIPLIELAEQRGPFCNTLKAIRSGDNMPKQVKARTPDIRDRVQFKVGHVFRHKRYHYQAVITGWDSKCEQSPAWIEQMGVHTLPRGPNQSFYHIRAEDRSTRYVAEENIELIQQDVSENLMAMAGEHFKRYDKMSRMFVSNIRDEYPDN